MAAPSALVKAGCIHCTEKPSGAAVKAAGCIEKPSVPNVTRGAPLIPVSPGLWQMPDEEVQWVLSRRREDVPSDHFGPDCVEDLKAVRDEFFELQEWMRAEYLANGWHTHTEPLDLSDLKLSDRLSDFYEDSEDAAVEVCTN